MFATTVAPSVEDHSAIWLYFFPGKGKGSGELTHLCELVAWNAMVSDQQIYRGEIQI